MNATASKPYTIQSAVPILELLDDAHEQRDLQATPEGR